MKLYPKFALIILTGALLSIISIGSYTYIATRSALADSIGKRQLEITEQAMDKIDRMLYERIVDIRMIAKSSSFVKDLQQHKGNSVLKQDTTTKELTDFTTVIGPWYEVKLVDLNGKTLHSNISSTSGEMISAVENEAFQKAKEGEVFVSDVVTIGKPTVVYAVPIHDTTQLNEPVVGAVIGHFAWDSIQDILEELEPQAFLLNKQGKIIEQNTFNEKKRVVGDNIRSLFPHFSTNYKPDTSIISEPDTKYARELLASVHPQLGYLDYKGSGWSLVVETPTTVAFQSAVLISRRLVLATSVIALLATFFIIVIFGKVFIIPIRLLITTSQLIAAGNLQKRVPFTRKDELGDLAYAFNDMAQKLQEVYGILEKKVSEKTAELATKVEQMGVQNTTLANTKTAMLNLLEDAKELEEKLKIEKMSVEQKVIERTKQFNEEAAKLQASINTLNVGVVMTDTHERVLMMNKAAKQLLTSQELSLTTQDADTPSAVNVNITISNIQKYFGDAFNVQAEINACITAGKSKEYKEITIGTKVAHLFISPIKTVFHSGGALEGEIIGVIVVMQDITEQKLVERSKDEFFSIASHELRTPLTAIKGNTSMIRDMYADKLTDPDLKQMIDDIHDGSVRLITIVNDFLNISRLEQGRMVFKKEAFDMNEFIASTMKEVMPLAEDKKLAMTYEKPSDELPLAFGDKDRLKEVLINLLSNAVKFTDTGSITIGVSQLASSLKVSVTDTGHGIPVENQNLLFRKFQQASNNILTRDTTSSTGLGLYIAKLIMEGMNGTIVLEKSDVNKGSTFSFTLPIATASNAVVTKENHREDAGTSA